MSRRWAWRATLVTAILTALLVVSATPALAHASLVSSTPAQGTELTTAPTSVILHFSESVGYDAESLKVLDPHGRQIQTGIATHPSGDAAGLLVGLPANLPKGSYTVLWHVAAADSHPIRGTYTFGFGLPAGATPATETGDPVVTGLHTLFRSTELAGTLLLLGSVFLVLVLWPGGFSQTRWRRLVGGAWWVTVVSTVMILWLQGPYGASVGVAALGNVKLFGATLGTLSGRLLLLRLGALLVAAIVWGQARRKVLPPSRLDAGGLAFLLVESFSFAGHSGQGSSVPLAATMDALHLAAAAVWLGGLAVLVRVLLVARPTDDELRLLERWSRLAAGAVGVLVATGVYQAWRQTGSIAALLETGYGRLIITKVALLICLLGLADQGRRWVRRARRPGTEPDVRRLRAGVIGELAAGVVVLFVTALLVDSAPARQTYVKPFSSRIAAVGTDGDTITVVVRVLPPAIGRETVELEAYAPSGAVQRFTTADGTLQDTFNKFGPIRFTFSETSPGKGRATVVVPAAGFWQLTTQVHIDALTDYAAGAAYTVRPTVG